MPDLPFVLVNMAMTADGKIATANRALSSFGSRRDLQHLFELRATADAVMSGARTVEHENADLGPGPARFRRLRRRRRLPEHPLRIVVSGSGSIDPCARIFRNRSSPILVIASRRAGSGRLRRLREVAEVAVFGERSVDLASALRWLHQSRGVRRLLAEGGGELNAALFRAGLVDELHLTICPCVAGGRTAPTIADGPPAAALAAAIRGRIASSRLVGDESYLVVHFDG